MLGDNPLARLAVLADCGNACAGCRRGDRAWGYFRENVIGGPGAFVIMAREPEDYSIALLRKMMLEIIGLDRAPPRLGGDGGDLD